MNKLGIGVIGVGLTGLVHVKTFSQFIESKVVAVADKNEDRAKEIAGQYNCDSYQDYWKLVQRQDVDAVVIATPDYLHLDPVIAAAEAGKHILLEKPIATEAQDAKQIIALTKKHGVKLMIGHILRFDPRYYAVKTAVEEGTIGKPALLYARRLATINEPRRLSKAWDTVSTILYLAIHDVDIALWLTKNKVKYVYAEKVEGKVMQELNIPDYYCFFARFESGALATFECGWGLPGKRTSWAAPKSWGGTGEVALEVLGENGSLHIVDPMLSIYECNEEGWKIPNLWYWPQIQGQVSGALREQNYHFLKCLTEDKEPLITGEDGYAALRVILAAIKSSEEHKPIELSSI